MATKNTGWGCTHSASIISEDNTSAKIRVTAYWQNDGWNYDINSVSSWVYCNGSEQRVKDNGSVSAPDNHGSYSQGSYDFTISKGTAKKDISCYAKITTNSSYVSGTKSSSATSVSIAAKPSYTVSYNANGGSGAPSSQTKWYGTNLTLSSTKPTRTGYSFAGWATSSSGSVAYQPGGTYSSNTDVTLYAKWTANTYTVSYNANGGSGAPSSQTKWYGTNLTLSSIKPTRTDYNFLGWSTSASGGVVYESGAEYTKNSNITLYAVWELAYVKPRITGFSAQRCDSTGVNIEDGTYVKVTFNWATDNEVQNIKIEWKIQKDNIWSNYTITGSGTSGSVNQIIGNGTIDNEMVYVVKAYVQDRATNGITYSPQISIGTIKFPIDIKRGGVGVAIGKAAEEVELLDVAWDAKFNKDVNIQGNLKINEVSIFDLIYPVGAIYMSVNTTDPSTLFGGSWIRIKDRFLLSAGDTYSAGSTGGSATHTLTVDEIPSHTHNIYNDNSGGYDLQVYSAVAGVKKGYPSNIVTMATGGGQPHNNMPPYLTVYVWKRTA